MEDDERRLWSRSDKLSLSPEGRDAEEAYRAAIVASREASGRASFDAARAEWAEARSLQPDDGVYLGELVSGPLGFSAVVTALDTCGKSRQDATKAFNRLIKAGHVVVGDGSSRDSSRD